MRLFVAVIVLFASLGVHAAPVTWTLNNVVYEAGSGYEEDSTEYGTASGSFVFDADTGNYSDVYISNSGPKDPYGSDGGYYDWFGYSFGTGSNEPVTGGANVLIAHSLPLVFPADPPAESIVFIFSGFLTNAGGEVFLAGGGTLGYSGSTPNPADGRRQFISGSVVASSVVPIPAAVWLFGSALAGLGWLRRMQAT